MNICEVKEILIIDDTTETIKVLIDILKDTYTTYFAKTAKKGIELAKKKRPDIILLDILMPEIDGYEACRRLKEDPATANIPVIFVTAVSEAMDMAKGFYLGGVDYVTKPFIPEVVKARVATHLMLSESIQKLESLYNLALDANPMTGLPGNNSIRKQIEDSLRRKADVCVVHADLDNFKAYNDSYGFAMGDDVLMFTASVLNTAINALHPEGSFLGHIGGDDFVMVLPQHSVDRIATEIINRFDSGITDYYSQEDREAQAISAKSRTGETQTFPIMTLSISGVCFKHANFTEYLQVVDACTELKSAAKKEKGSCFKMERRSSQTDT